MADVAAWLALLLVPAIVFESIRRDSSTSLESSWPIGVRVLAVLAAALVSWAAWAIRAQRPLASIGLSLVAAGAVLPVCAGWAWLPSAIRAGAVATSPLVAGGAAQVAMGWTVGGGGARWVRLSWVLAGLGSLIHLVGYDPFADPSCSRTCESVQTVAAGLLDTHQAVVAAATLVVGACVLAGLAVARAATRVPPVVVGGVLLTLAASAAPWVERAASWGERSDDQTSTVVWSSVALAVLGLGVIDVARRTRRTRRRVERLVASFSTPANALQATGGDLQTVHFAVPGDGRWVDSAGRVVVAGEGDCCEIADEAGPMVRLPVSTQADQAELQAQLTPAALLSLRNAQLAAVTKARMIDVQASRRRLVSASDAERQRIERDLHDGAQQRLVSAAFYLSVARSQAPSLEAPLTASDTLVSEALSKLRALAHGIFPSVLAAEGLRAAIEDLVDTVDCPAVLDIQTDEAVPIEPAMVAYAAVAAALDAGQAANATGARIVVERVGDVLGIRIDLDAPSDSIDTSELREVDDRVTAFGGVLRVSSQDAGTTITVELPCE